MHLSCREGDRGRIETVDSFSPFLWVRDASSFSRDAKVEVKALAGTGDFRAELSFSSRGDYEKFLMQNRGNLSIDSLRSMESQYLLQSRKRLFGDLVFADLRRCQCDIETASSREGRFSDPRRAGDRILAIGLQFDGRTEVLELEEDSDAAEKDLLERFTRRIQEEDPDTLEGHNIFRFDLDYLRVRSRKVGLPCAWGRFGKEASFRNSRLKVAERWIDFPRCDLPGRTVCDTYLMVLLYDITGRELAGYGLKEVALHMGITPKGGEGRTYIPGDQIQGVFHEDRGRFREYLLDDLRETQGVADMLLPTYFAQATSFPMTLQELTLRGASGKIDLLFLEEYFHAKQALPSGGEVSGYVGGFSKSYVEGVYQKILHFDVASLYPSLLLMLGRNPKNDSLGVFIPLLQQLREYRLKYKTLAREEKSSSLRREYFARQAAFKIIINSFYGYLGFPNARFGDPELAAEVTARGREILQSLVQEFSKMGCTILEADTDGIYLSSEEYFDEPARLLEKTQSILPEGIDLEFAGSYQSMFCYKAKNYALYDGEEIMIRGSALRSRGMEPFLKKLTDQLIGFLLGVEDTSPLETLETLRERIEKCQVEINEIAKSENLSQSPEKYLKALNGEKRKPRRASLEAALKMNPVPKMGDRVTYYIAAREKGMTADWQRAHPVGNYDPERAPYDPLYYTKKLDEWRKRYEDFLDGAKSAEQGELF